MIQGSPKPLLITELVVNYNLPKYEATKDASTRILQTRSTPKFVGFFFTATHIRFCISFSGTFS
jgi:hypothetical protein